MGSVEDDEGVRWYCWLAARDTRYAERRFVHQLDEHFRREERRKLDQAERCRQEALRMEWEGLSLSLLRSA